jgi:hypothetical protein
VFFGKIPKILERYFNVECNCQEKIVDLVILDQIM